MECLLCQEYCEKYNSAFPFSDRRSVGHEIRRHLKMMYHYPRICFREFRRFSFLCVAKSATVTFSCEL